MNRRRNCRESRTPLGSAGCVKFDSDVGNCPLGAGYPLLHRSGRHQKCLGDLLDREPGHDAKREGNRLGRGQGGGAHEHQPQDVVSIVTLVQAFRS